MALRLTRTRTVALVATVLVCALATWMWRDPMAPLAHGAMILLAGALLVTPGFFTDTCGLLLLIPKVRHFVIREFGKRVQVAKFEMGTRAGGFSAGFGTGPQSGHPFHRGADQDGVIDGDFSEIEPTSAASAAAV